MSAVSASDSQLGLLLRTSGRLTLLIEVLRSGLLWGAILLAAILIAVLIDGLLGLQPWGLLAADLAGAGLVLFGAIMIWRTLARHWFDPRRTAQIVEGRLGLRDGRLINAWDLASTPPRGASPALIKQAVSQANAFAREVPVSETLRARPLGRAAGVLFGAVCIGLGGLVLIPGLFAAVLPRLADPWGDHPPFTLVTFDVRVEPEPVFHGRSATIKAKLGGPEEITRANVVFVEGDRKSGRPTHAMLRRPEGEFVLPIDKAEANREFYIDTPRGRSRKYQLTVLPVPTFEATDVRYRFPKYTGWPDSRHVLDTRGIRALQGTDVTVSVTSNVPLKSATLELIPAGWAAPITSADGSSNPTNKGEISVQAGGRSPPYRPVIVTLKPKDRPLVVSGTFVLKFSGHYRLTLTGADGTESREKLEGELVATEDQPPQIEFLEPAPLTLAVENWKVPVVLSARDDVGLDGVKLHAGVNGWGPHELPVEVERPQPNAIRGQHVFDLAALGATAGDVLTFYATARDNRPPEGQSVDTPIYVIQVISHDEYLDMARSKYQMDEVMEEFEMFQKKLEDIQKRREQILKEIEALEKKLAEGSLDKEDLARLQKLQQQLDAYQEAAESLAKELAKRAEQTPLYDFEEQYAESLKKLSEQMQQQSDAAKAAHDAAEQLRKQPQDKALQKALKDALEKLAKETQPFEQESLQERQQTAEDLDKLQKADRLLSQAERLQSLIQQQRDLADRMAEFRDEETLTPEQEQRARQLAKEQELLQEELDQTVQDLEKTAGECEKCLPKTSGDAKKLCEAIREGNVPGDQQQAAKAARQGQGREAHERAEAAARKLEALQKDCCNAEGLRDELDAGLSLSKPGQSLGKNSLKQLSQGRMIPGFGQKPGEGEGRSGSQAQVSIAGPHLPSTGQPRETRDGRLGEGGRGRDGNKDPDNFDPGTESLTPQSRTGRTSSAGNLRGVPVRYRDQAEAFFKRLAEEK